MNEFDVRNFGAIGDGETETTAAVQKAIDACAEAGGGTVTVAGGDYVIRSIYLRSNITLRIENGARLSAYPHPGKDVFDAGVICAKNCHDVTIEGDGMIYGNDKAFWIPMKPEEITAHPFRYKADNVNLPRPRMIYISGCDYVTIRDISVAASPVYAAHFCKTNHISVRGIKVRNDQLGPNTDGFHFGSCQYVSVEGCLFVCGDDCVAIDSCEGDDSRFTTVTNCVFDSTINAIRVYTGIDRRRDPDYRHDVSDVTITNCTTNACGIFNVTAERGKISNIVMSDFTINVPDNRTGVCAFLMTANGEIEDCLFSNVTAHHNGALTLVGEPGRTIRRVTFENMRMHIKPVKKAYGLDLPENLGVNYVIHHYSPYNIYLRNTEDVILRNIRMDFEQSDIKDSFPAVKVNHCVGTVMEGLNVKAYGDAPDIVTLDSDI